MLIALALVTIAIAAGLGYAWGRRGDGRRMHEHPPIDASVQAQELVMPTAHASPPCAAATACAAREDPTTAERARLIRSYEAETARVRGDVRTSAAEVAYLRELAEERCDLFRVLAQTRYDTARYRQLVIDIENNAPPPLLGGRGAPDDLRLIVGIGPVLERMLHQLGITTYRQIARWTERDIDDIDARLTEFPGRIRRDGWVTQARALHQGLHGESL